MSTEQRTPESFEQEAKRLLSTCRIHGEHVLLPRHFDHEQYSAAGWEAAVKLMLNDGQGAIWDPTLGFTGGFDFDLVDREANGPEALQAELQALGIIVPLLNDDSPAKAPAPNPEPPTAAEKRKLAQLELEKFLPAGNLLISPDGWLADKMIWPIMQNLLQKANAGQVDWDDEVRGFRFPKGADIPQILQPIGVTVRYAEAAAGSAALEIDGAKLRALNDEQAADDSPLFDDLQLQQFLDKDLASEETRLPDAPQLLPTDSIEVDPNQARKTMSAEALKEMQTSLINQGQLQAILVRPVNKPGSPIRFMIVFGERRWRACVAAGIKMIKAEVRHLTDQEVMEIQLVENMHREDVHPMEEATYFQLFMAKVPDSTLEDIADKIGRPAKYVAKRLRLTKLTTQWQNLYLRGGFGLKEAMLLASVSPEAQDDYAKIDYVKRAIKKWDGTGPLELWNMANHLQQRTKALERAPFSIVDPTLNPQRGACITCQFNTAVGHLFLEPGEKPTCTLMSCWQIKEQEAFKRAVTHAVANDIVLLVPQWMGDEGRTWKASAEAAGGTKFLEDRKDFRTVSGYPDDPGTWEQWMEMEDVLEEGTYIDGVDGQDGHHATAAEAAADQEQARVRYDQEVADYQTKLEAWNKKHPGATRGLWAAGSERGKVVAIEITTSGQVKGSQGLDSARAFKEKISTMTEKAQRSDELDYERLWLDLRKLVLGELDKKGKRMEPVIKFKLAKDLPLQQVELGAVCVALAGKLIQLWHQDEGKEILDYLKFPRKESDKWVKDEDALKAVQAGADERLLHHLLRMYLKSESFPAVSSHIKNQKMGSAYLVLQHYQPNAVTELELQYDGKRLKRADSLKKRIAEVERQAEAVAAAKKEASKTKRAAGKKAKEAGADNAETAE